MGKSRQYYILWPKGSGKKPEKATTDWNGSPIFEAAELPEPIMLGPETVSDFKGESQLLTHVGKNLRIAMVEGKKIHVSDTGSSIITSLALDRDSAMGPQQTAYMRRLGAQVDDARVMGKEYERLGIDRRFLNQRVLSNVRTALEADSPEKILEGVASMRKEEAESLYLLSAVFRNELTAGLPLAVDFHERIGETLSRVLDPNQRYGRVRNAFALKSHELGERFDIVERSTRGPGKNYAVARDAAEGVMEHYAAISDFTVPSRDMYYDKLQAGLRHPDPQVRGYLAASVVYTKIGRTTPEMLKLLGDDNKTVVKAAVMALGEIGHPKAAQPVGRILRAAADPEVREIAAMSLSRIGTEQALGILTRWEPKETDETIKADIAGYRKRMKEKLKLF